MATGMTFGVERTGVTGGRATADTDAGVVTAGEVVDLPFEPTVVQDPPTEKAGNAPVGVVV